MKKSAHEIIMSWSGNENAIEAQDVYCEGNI